ncbi:universal stress protein [Actinomadura roseirufa]|uniref:universal stress protein n=1 Tax=Actinomadura roseirufa TaxID=2094049 RepID=UPI0010418851|nr:universal stress protein [Actinomadura roseirufa]
MSAKGPQSVLVGYDGSEENDAALRWAVEEAGLRERPLVMCHCWHWPYPDGHIDPEVEMVVRRVGENLLEHGASRARELDAGVTVRTRLMSGPVQEALLHEARESEMIVVGSHEPGRGPVRPSVLRLAARARRPVVVARDGGGGDRPVVAGVDGSAGGDAALGFAFEEAALRGLPLRAVYGCWEPGAVDEAELALFSDRERLERTRAAMLERVIGPWSGKYPEVKVETVLRLERPREVLLEEAEAAGLLVVGDRGARGIDPLLLGATSSAMLHHAPCTVVIVPPS